MYELNYHVSKIKVVVLVFLLHSINRDLQYAYQLFYIAYSHIFLNKKLT